MRRAARAVLRRRREPAIGFFERWLTLWVLLCIVAGIALGQWLPAPFQALGRMEVARVNMPVGLLIWVMIIPMLLRIDFARDRPGAAALARHRRDARSSTGLVKPFSMALLGWIFMRHVFAPYLPADQIDSYVAGLILLAAAPCTAMVFVWSQLYAGRPLLHAEPGRAQRRDHGRRVRADRRPAARAVGHHGALGHACSSRSCSTSSSR